jgi:DNA-binding transcriptional regulator YiaG
MKYSHKSKHRKNCSHDPDHRAQLGYRLRTARCNMGWTVESAAKYFQVTERTWHNWESGRHRIPFAVYKLCRVLARLELPGDAWAGWSFQGSALITPEGRRIEPQDASWWTLMVRNAQSFSAAYNEAARLRLLVADLQSAARQLTGGASAPASGAAAGLVPSKTSLQTSVDKTSDQYQNDVIIKSWPTLYDFQKPLTPLHAPKPITSESPLTPSFVSPWMPTCGVRLSMRRPQLWPHQATMPHLKQVNSPNLQSSPEPKSRPSTNGKKPNANATSHASARPAAAGAASLASAARGQQ